MDWIPRRISVWDVDARLNEVRCRLDPFFSTLPAVRNGFLLKTWGGGPEAGEPKLRRQPRELIARGLTQIEKGGSLRWRGSWKRRKAGCRAAGLPPGANRSR